MTRLSIIVPALDAAGRIGATLRSVDTPVSGVRPEIIVVDGGSADRTADAARAAGARVIVASRGRGGQLAAGAAAASGDWLLFLHADTVLAPGWPEAAACFMDSPAGAAGAAAFRLVLDDPSPAARRLERMVAWRCRVLALPYGDQGLLIGRALYDALGGFRALPLYEDVDLVRRLGRARLTMLPVAAFTSAERYRRAGYVVRPLRNLCLLALYFAGVPPRALVRLYG
jgi:rSAM/selenodomain-associated transferase 2